MTTKYYIPFCPPEFADYLEWMEKCNYGEAMLKTNLGVVKNIGYILANSDMDSRKLAEMVSPIKGTQTKIAIGVNDYRHFLKWKFRRETQFETVMSLKDKVLV